jgi:hypothetical protein
MFRFNFPKLFSVKQPVKPEPDYLANIPETPHKAAIPENVWKDDLDKLVVDKLKRLDAQIEYEMAEQSGLPVKALLAEDEDQETSDQKERPKRASDGTVNDIKVWWGEALTPWNSSAIRDLDSSKETSGTKAHKHWFGR